MHLIREQFAAFEICHYITLERQSTALRNGHSAAIQTHSIYLADSIAFAICYPVISSDKNVPFNFPYYLTSCGPNYFGSLLAAGTYQCAALQTQEDSSCASGRTPPRGSALLRIHTRGCGCDCTPAWHTAAPCTPVCSTDTRHWCARCLCSSRRDKGHTRSSTLLYSAVLSRCQEDTCRTSAGERFLGHDEGTLEEMFPGWSI